MLAPIDYQAHWAEGMSAEAYHATRYAVSSTGLRKILKSPATFKAEVIDGAFAEETEAMKFGTLAHRVMLEGTEFLKEYVVMPEFVGKTKDGRDSTRSKEATDKRDAWLLEAQLAGQTIVTQEDFDTLHGMLDALLAHNDAMWLIKDCVTEISGFYADPETGILCRIRPDILAADLGALVDYKTTRDCEMDAFSRSIWDLRYDFQLAMYRAGIQEITGKNVDYVAFIAQEKKKPYEVAVYVADREMLKRGNDDYRTALKTLRNCIDTQAWPGYQNSIENISLPYWIERNA